MIRRTFAIAIILMATLAFVTASENWIKFSANPPGEFSNDPNVFYGQLREMFGKIKSSETQKTVETFIAGAQAGKISAPDIQELISLCNLMSDRKMRITPHYNSYFQAINSMMTAEKSNKFGDWHSIVKDLLLKSEKGQYNNLMTFLSFSENFFAADLLDKTSGKRWVVQTSDYKFKYDNNIPTISFDEASLYCATAKDTMYIIDTKGDFFPLENKWSGKTGRVTWERTGFDPNSVYCEIAGYQIDFQKTEYKVEDAVFYHKKYFNRPLKGTLEDMIWGKVNNEYIYPKFTSYELDIFMKNFAPQTEFRGGFGMSGSQIIGYGKESQLAELTFFSKDNREVLLAKSTMFGLKEDKEVSSTKTSVSLYFANDSIYHPQLNMRYLMGSDPELRLVRDGKASSKIAFMSSYHHIEANLDAVFWKMNTPVVNMQMVSQLKELPVMFESFNLYEASRLERYRRGTSDIDPVAALYAFSNGGQFKITALEFAKFMNANYTAETVHGVIFDLVEDGFIYYDPDTDIITIREKTDNYMRSKKQEIDYDRILVVSRSKVENAQLDLESKELLITGVNQVTLSDSQQVRLFPDKGFLRVRKDRNMQMDGTIVAGSVDFVGKDFDFDYNPFLVNLDSIDQMKIYLLEDNDKEKNKLIPINTLIRSVTGTLFIDEANNKSGLTKYPSYPRFESKGNSYLYYDDKSLYNGAYKRDIFHFKLDPFKFPDLDEITPDLLTFPGTMITGDIFPPFKQVTSLQPDNSLGFVNTTDAAGMLTYKKGKFFGVLDMSNKGLIGKGRIEYLSSTSLSENFIFLPDSMMAACDSFYMVRKKIGNAEFPSAHNGKVNIRWRPNTTGMNIYMTDAPFSMFEDKVTLKGSLALAESGLTGKGTINWPDAAMRADALAFTSGTFQSDSADVQIKNKDAARVSFNSYNVKARVDMDQYLGEFLANGPSIPIDLPFNRFKTNAKEFYWLMKDKLINLRMPEDPKLSYFESTDPKQEGLKFQASGGVVNLEDNTVKADGIAYIEIGDARIRPPDTQIFIEPDANIRPLENALIVADSIKEYHKLYKAKVKILGKNQMDANGEYRYRGKNLKRQDLFFEKITTEKDAKDPNRYYTYGTTNIPENTEFKISPNISYKGNAILDSREPFLVFDGFAKIELKTKEILSQWFTFRDVINPDSISIDVSAPIGEFKDSLTFGFLQDMQLLDLYPAFLTKKRSSVDPYLFVAGGEMDYNADKNIFIVGSKERLSGKESQGNIFTLKDNIGEIVAEGMFDLGKDWGMTRLDAAGQLTHKVGATGFNFKDMLIGFDFYFDEALLTNLGEAVRYFNAAAPEVDYSKESFYNAAVAMVDKKEVGELKRMLGTYNYLAERKKGIDHRLIFTNVQMVFDTITRTFISNGKLGLSFSGEKYVNRMVDGWIEIGLRQSGNFVNIYIETAQDDQKNYKWYFFHYKKGVLQAISSDPLFNDAIAAAKDKKRIKENKSTGEIYQYSVAPMERRNVFVYTMRGGPPEPPPPPPPSTDNPAPTENTPVEPVNEGDQNQEQTKPVDEGNQQTDDKGTTPEGEVPKKQDER
ncbi:MAG: hypothetical protein IPM47_17560 [Sphingobacteriales bacterium]|nr:MAG: hypothetical protein IPM47_17560 [Sphingobacteriales bacterium]